MNKVNRLHRGNGLVPYKVIVDASNGDIKAIEAVLKHYEIYIIKLCMRILYDSYGNRYTCLDEEMKHRLEQKLTIKILTFRVA